MSDTLFYMPDRVIARQSGLLDRAQNLLTDAGLKPVLFDQVERDPAIPTVLAAADLAKSCHLNCARALPRMKRPMDLHDYTRILQRAF